MPCIIRSPRLAPGIREEVASSIDIAATLLALAGVDGGPRQEARPVASRDLTVVPERPARVFGMRRTYREPYEDRRLDGSVHVLEGHLFYFVNEEGELYRGSREEVIPPAGAAALAEGEAHRLRALFGGFEDEFVDQQAEVGVDPEVEKGLRALGYVE